MKGGYAGKLLFVDLATGVTREEPLSDEMARSFIGGYGIGARVLYSMMKPGADPLGPDNVLGMVTGPVTGTESHFSGRHTVVCKSPVSGTWNDASSGGLFRPGLKRAGFDAVLSRRLRQAGVPLDQRWPGRAARREKLWGLDAKETQIALEDATGDPKLRAVVIGPSGEKLSLLACVMNNGHRAAGRGGPGAVMDPELKAIAVPARAGSEPPIPRDQATERHDQGGHENSPLRLRSGRAVPAWARQSALSGDSPVKNWGGVGIVEFSPRRPKRWQSPRRRGTRRNGTPAPSARWDAAPSTR